MLVWWEKSEYCKGNDMLDRRIFIAFIGALAVTGSARAAQSVAVDVYYNPT